ncbi:MAG: PTS sugar transporter subunit IIC [Oscillospiraceae bacterium]|nr:PTS sugar transporter subunit IIC [Oscillospiraceae bacterium]
MIQALLVGLWVTWAIIDEQTLQLQTTRPIITGTVVGLIMGDVTMGLMVGATVELMFLAVVFVGTAVPPDPTLSAAIATALAIATGSGIEVAIATAIPVALIGQAVTTLQFSVVNVFFLHRGDKAAAAGSSKGLMFYSVLPLAVNVLFYGVPAFLAVYYGPQFVLPLIEAIPEQVIRGLAVGGGMIGAVGFALLLKSIKATHLWPYFLVGMIAMVYLNLNLIGIGLVAVTAAALHMILSKGKSTKGSQQEEEAS